ncbi:hypothetical protein [Sphingobium fluviale]|uniref:Uncharacterized protein n=1 Tax=Sphingobium fluviale TaxID=2506423 RepID=A0A4Q1KM37_9SPHN|nr:hypothetical protein [Sphingobium fluviale]RXR30837.1 hypothetical protein EQG66_00650 [Sphingobium fluviale]
MPKMTDRERLADLEARQRKMGEEVEKARRALRGKYAAIVPELAVETLTEREFRDLVVAAIRVGGAAAIAALKPLPESTDTPKPPAKRVPATSMA